LDKKKTWNIFLDWRRDINVDLNLVEGPVSLLSSVPDRCSDVMRKIAALDDCDNLESDALAARISPQLSKL